MAFAERFDGTMASAARIANRFGVGVMPGRAGELVVFSANGPITALPGDFVICDTMGTRRILCVYREGKCVCGHESTS